MTSTDNLGHCIYYWADYSAHSMLICEYTYNVRLCGYGRVCNRRRGARRVWCDGDRRLGDGVDVHCSGGGSRALVCIMGQLEFFLSVFFEERFSKMSITIDSNEAGCKSPTH